MRSVGGIWSPATFDRSCCSRNNAAIGRQTPAKQSLTAVFIAVLSLYVEIIDFLY
jgi:hypothetical protein